MISFRHHLVTLVAVFVALAVGIVLGGGVLSDQVAALREAPADLVKTPADPDSEKLMEFADNFASATATTLYAGQLADHEVSIVTLPGVDAKIVADLMNQVNAANGTIASTVAVADPVLNPAERTLIDTMGSQLVAENPGLPVAEDASTYDRIGQLIAGTVATNKPTGSSINGRSKAVIETLSGAGLISISDDPARRAPLLLVVLGTAPDAEQEAMLTSLVTGLAQPAQATVVVGTFADGPTQLATLASADTGAALVDSVDVSLGQTAAVLALIRGLTTPGGSFGAFGADGPVPLG